MPRMTNLPARAVGILLMLASTALAAGTYHDSLVEGDRSLTSRQADAALQAYDAAVGQSKSDGERALALGKKGYVLAYLKKDYPQAREAVDAALEVKDLAPVARVTILQVLAHCQMQADKDYEAAAKNLEEALSLEGVEWAKPALMLALGDCRRESGKMDDALATYASLLAMEAADSNLKAVAHLCSGFIYQYDRHDAAKARDCYANAVKLRPDLKPEVDGHLGRLP